MQSERVPSNTGVSAIASLLATFNRKLSAVVVAQLSVESANEPMEKSPENLVWERPDMITSEGISTVFPSLAFTCSPITGPIRTATLPSGCGELGPTVLLCAASCVKPLLTLAVTGAAGVTAVARLCVVVTAICDLDKSPCPPPTASVKLK